MESLFSFSDALIALKEGKRIARLGWNGKSMWLALCTNWNGNVVPDSEDFEMLPFIYMRTAQADLVPWLASQTDILAEDWRILS